MSYEQAVVNLQETNAELVKAVNRVRDAAMGMNRMYSSTSAGVAAVQDGEYFVVPGGGVYQRLYQRSGGSASLIAEYPDKDQLSDVITQLGPLLGRGVTSGLENFSSPGDLVKLEDAVFASRSDFGFYYSGSSATANVDLAIAGECALYSISSGGVFPAGSGTTFLWVETQKTYSGESLRQTAVNYRNGGDLVPRQWIRICANNLDANGERQWGPWAEIFTTQNILGTVSESGGIPTGAIIERGSNANGEYVKFADGTVIMSTTGKEVTLDANSASALVFDLPSLTTSTYSAGLTYIQNTGGSTSVYSQGRVRCEFYGSATGRIANVSSTESTATFVVTHIGRWF